MSNTTKNKSSFLGMPHGTANGRLRKNILFWLVQKCEEDTCYKCKKKILSPEELSIEHKKPWENISIDLFWDLDNIAFSHLKCNRPHTYNPHHKIVRPNDKVEWCCFHQTFHEKELFAKVWKGNCKEAERLRMQKARNKNKNYGR